MNKPVWRWIVAIVSLVLVSPCFALQTKTITDNEAINADISINELTRIAVDQDRIVRVRGLDGVYDMKNDPIQGALFIRPMADNQKKPFTLFIATEQNHNYVLHLMPKDQAADTILLKPKGVQKEKAARWESSSPYIKTLTFLMTAMMTNTVPPGYAVDVLHKVKRQHLNHHLKVQLVRVCSGCHLKGYVYRVINQSKHPRTLTESDFYQAGDRSIALSNLTIAPKGEVFLYRVKNDE